MQVVQAYERRYLRVCLGSESGDPGMTLYEVDDEGWVYRQVQLYAEGTRFTPENILMCQPVNIDAMTRHPAAEEIDVEEFELLWGELHEGREFLERIPDPMCAWEGTMNLAGRSFDVQWQPSGIAPRGYAAVPGFVRLFVRGDDQAARTACAAVFIENPIEWSALSMAA